MIVISTFKTSTLENDNFVIKKIYHQIPPKVEYSLSQKGESLIPILNEMCIWGKKHKK